MVEVHLGEKAIFAVASSIDSDESRALYLKQVCSNEPEMMFRIVKLLQMQHDDPEYLESPASYIEQIGTSTAVEMLGSSIGPYKLIEQIGEGGMGVVYMAAQKEPVRRTVALKVIKAGMDTQQVVARFEAERQAMAMMNHPNIAKVLDAGATEAGRPYFVMELVKGAPITEFCDNHKLDTKHRLQLFITVCQAVQHAHQKGLIHRDIKPSNVMVEMHDVTPVPKVIDFGVAKAIGHQLTEKTLHSGFHQMVGTPLYMSPEQAGQSSIDIDTRSDIYSLGVLLYEILTGHTPFESDALRDAGYDEMRRMIREVDPPRPSLRVSTLDAKALSTISDNRNVDARKLSHQLRGELDWIVMMALEKDRNRRYDTANEFADDVQRFLNDEAVHACPPSTLYRFRKLASRNRASLSAATLVAAALIIGAAVATWQAMRARDSQAQTEIAKQQIDERYRIAKDAVDTYLLRVTRDERLDHPSFRELRQSLLEAALPYYDQLHKISPIDEQSRAARAETLNQLGGVKRDLGRFDESLASFEESAKLFDHLSADNTAKIDYRQSLAKVLVNLADHYRTRGATSESLEYEQHALALRQQLASEHPDNDLLHLELAQSYTNVGVGSQEMDGREMLERAIEIWQELVDRFPHQTLYREYLSLGYQNLANRFAWDQAEQAIPFHEQAIGLLEQLAKEQPESKKAHIQWAQSHQSLADTLEKLSSRLSDAREHCEESIRILKAFAKRHPESPEVKSHLANSMTKLAHTLKELDELVKAHETCDSALRLWEQLQSEYPDMLEYEVGMAAAQQNLGAIVVAQGQATEGMSMLTQSRDRLQKLVNRIGPHDRSNELLRTITSSLADTRKVMDQGRERSSDEGIFETNIKTAGEALLPSKFLTDLSNSPTHGLRVGGMASSLTQTEEQEQSMKRLLTKHSRSATRPQIRNERPLRMEQLEARELFAVTVSVANSTMDEIGAPSAFVTAGNGGLTSPRDAVIGPDSQLYVASTGTNSILRYNSNSGQLVGTFVTTNSGGLDSPFGLAFGPDGNLYVSEMGSGISIKRYSGTSGAFIDTYVPTGSGGMNSPLGIAFGSDGNLYVGNKLSNSVLRFQGPLKTVPGSPLPSLGNSGADFVSPGNSGLSSPVNIAFGPDGDLYVTSTSTNIGVFRFSKNDGSYVSTPVSPGEGGLGQPRGMAFDQDGRLFVADVTNSTVHRFDNQGQFLDDLIAGPSSNPLGPIGLVMDSEGALIITGRDSNSIVRYDRGVVASLSATSANSVSVNYATFSGTAIAGSDFTGQSGVLTFRPGQTTRRLLLAARDDQAVESNESFTLEISNATAGATIGTGIATVTIVDDESRRQISVSDASATEGSSNGHYRGAFVNSPAGTNFNDLTFGPDGDLYTSPGPSGGARIDRYNGTTGDFIGHFVPAGMLTAARDIVFRSGYMYVADEGSDQVFRFDATTGNFVDIFVSAGSGGIDAPHGMTFGPDTNGDGVPELYVSGRNSFTVVRYDGATGQALGAMNTSGSGALLWPENVTVGPGNVLYVASTGNNLVQKYNALTGAYLGAVSSTQLVGPKAIRFSPINGLMYVGSSGNGRILRFDSNDHLVDDFVPAGSGGMQDPYRMEFGPDGDLYVSALGSNQILRFGTESEVLFTVSSSVLSSFPVTISYSTTNASALAGSDYVYSNGTITFDPGVSSKIIRVPILDDNVTEPTENFILNLSNPLGGTIGVGQAIGSILDNDPFTKFYVVNDASTDRTYEYGETGASVENYALAGGNTAPRGAVSTAAGTKVWVVDANKSVYAYDTSGDLQGSWVAGGLQSTAQLEGIATNGTDVWLVDNKTDKVYRYANAASLTNGSPLATSSFSLNSGNTSPKDIVTDGNYLWVVNDSSTDKVFKYTIGGTYVGSWTISTSGASSPTGITLDPSNPSAIWIVDSRTAKVYQYDNVVGLTSGSKSANSSWALAAGNTNPQGIADPPPPAVLGAPGKASDVKSPFAGAVPITWFSGSTANDGSVSLQQVQSKVRTTDEFMSVLGLAFEQPKALVSVNRITDVASTKSIDHSAGIDTEIKDYDMDELIGLVAHDLWR